MAKIVQIGILQRMGAYRNGTTLGGKIGCGMAALVGMLLIGGVVILSSLGDCAPGVECHSGLDWPLLGGAVAITAAVGFGIRSLTNWVAGRWGNGS